MIGILITIFCLAFLILFTGNFLPHKLYKFLGILPLLVFLVFVFYAVTIRLDKEILLSYSWIPKLGINLDFKLDGLSILFSLLISGIGVLIYFYASYYLKNYTDLNKFYCYLTLFMGSMLGLVLSDNLITIFMFWELTSITSFFLIGVKNDDEKSRKSALLALGITGFGGFFLLSGFLILAGIGGSYSISELVNSSNEIQNHGLYILILVFIFIGAFTKSAQFPFHFWLPSAMQAPTPVSGYLHSATMVKAGVYLIARLTPTLSDGYFWNNTLLIVGGTTMIYAAVHSILRTDMKSILAYSTISALGIMFFLLGLGNEYSFYALVTFVVVHALYKACLFLVTGIVDHAVGTREIHKISGLGKLMPKVAIASFIAAFSCAGIPFMLGFISKDLMYESTLHFPKWGIWFTVLILITNILLACSGFMVGIKPFVGKMNYTKNTIELPNNYLSIPVISLSMLTLVFGIFPILLDVGIIKYAYQSISLEKTEVYLKLWHGFNLVLGLSTITIVFGTLLYLMNRNQKKGILFISKFDRISPQTLHESISTGFKKIAFLYTRFFHNGYLRNYLITMIIFITTLIGYRLFTTVSFEINTENLSGFRSYELVIFALIIVAVVFTIRTTSRLTAIACLGVIGYGICLIFVFYGAPDLAMTQFTIDTLTVVLFVLVLFKLPSFLTFKNRKIEIRDAIVSLSFGLLIMLIALLALVSPSSSEVSQFYAENSYLLAKGKNVVNVILVDFRGMDTLIETIVLSIAALGVYGLLKYRGINEETD